MGSVQDAVVGVVQDEGHGIAGIAMYKLGQLGFKSRMVPTS